MNGLMHRSKQYLSSITSCMRRTGHVVAPGLFHAQHSVGRAADAVRFPSVLASASKTRSRSTSRIGEPTIHRMRRRREAREIGS
jgi:hypothetical protein